MTAAAAGSRPALRLAVGVASDADGAATGGHTGTPAHHGIVLNVAFQQAARVLSQHLRILCQQSLHLYQDCIIGQAACHYQVLACRQACCEVSCCAMWAMHAARDRPCA